MTYYDKMDAMPLPRPPTSPGQVAGASIAVVNDEGQYAVWRADRRLPPGWRQQSAAMTEEDCLAFIDSAWPDIRPVSLRADGSAYSVEPGHDQQYAHLLFDRQADATPYSMAVVSAAGKVSYRQLAESVNQIADHLRGIGVGPETAVGVYLERGIDA